MRILQVDALKLKNFDIHVRRLLNCAQSDDESILGRRQVFHAHQTRPRKYFLKVQGLISRGYQTETQQLSGRCSSCSIIP